MDMSYEHPLYSLMAIVCIIVIAALILGENRKDKIIRLFKIQTGKYKKLLNNSLMAIGLLLIAFSAVGPKTVDEKITVTKDSLDMYILMDVSKSMLVEDVAPNRLEQEKQLVKTMISGLDGQRIGFIPFASSAYIQMPLTDDYDLATMFLDVVDTDMLGGGGSNIEDGIELALESFDRSISGDKVIIVVSDGEAHQSIDSQVLKDIKDADVTVYSFGVGTDKGGLIPIYNDDKTAISNYKKDASGQAVVSKLEDASLKKLAEIGKGKYYTITGIGEEAKDLVKQLQTLKKSKNKTTELKGYKHWYQWFLLPGFLCFLFGFTDSFGIIRDKVKAFRHTDADKGGSGQ